MTNREKAIIMAYTGTCMLAEDKIGIFYIYLEEILGRPIHTIELADKSVWDTIHEKSKADFLALCNKTTPTIDKRKVELTVENCTECPFACESVEQGACLTICKKLGGYSTIPKKGIRKDCPLPIDNRAV